MTGVPIHGTGMTSDDIVKRAHDTLPVATDSVPGVVKIGSGVNVTGDGTISVAGGGGSGAFPLAEDGFTETYPVVDGTGGDSYGHDVVLRSGANGGALYLKTGNDVDGGGVGAITLQTGDRSDGTSGDVNIKVGTPSGSAEGGVIKLRAGDANAGNGGNLVLEAGTGVGTGNHSGVVRITIPVGVDSAQSGQLILQNVPTSDPHVVDAMWNDAGTLKISAG